MKVTMTVIMKQKTILKKMRLKGVLLTMRKLNHCLPTPEVVEWQEHGGFQGF